ncbi:MAG: ABC transporter ATP-binding protein [Treponema sp.]|jgi:zinc transport system ATP-binding protein|nr:ABC transporter ATP-binding protein [Treponema sp.]
MTEPEAVFNSSSGKNPRPVHPLHRRVALEFEGVSFSYGETKVLENASFHIHEGEFVALVGPNGSGKTTVLKLLLGLKTPGAGKIELFGARAGYVPQQPPGDEIFPISVRNVVRMGRLLPSRLYSKEDRSAAEEALRQAEISDLADRPYGALSGGQRRRVLVARALAARPDILILDEPTANMDAESGERLFDILGKLKGTTTILIVTHDTDFVSSLTDRVLCMGDGGEPRYGKVRGLLQHGTEAQGMRGVSRVIHDGIPADLCCGENGGELSPDGDGHS